MKSTLARIALNLFAAIGLMAPVLAAHGREMTARETLDDALARAQRTNCFLIVHFGSQFNQSAAGTSPTLAFNDTMDKWLKRPDNAGRFVFCFVGKSREDWDACFADCLKQAGQGEDATTTPAIFLVSPAGKMLAYDNGGAWAEDTEANITTFLDKFVAKVRKSNK